MTGQDILDKLAELNIKTKTQRLKFDGNYYVAQSVFVDGTGYYDTYCVDEPFLGFADENAQQEINRHRITTLLCNYYLKDLKYLTPEFKQFLYWFFGADELLKREREEEDRL